MSHEVRNEEAKYQEVDKCQDKGPGYPCGEEGAHPWIRKKGMGLLHPKKALYNKVYRKTTFGLGDILKHLK